MGVYPFELTPVDGPYLEQTWTFERPELKALLDYWMGRRGDRSCPRWRDIELPVIYQHAPHIVVRDAIDGGDDFVNRFWGTQITEWLRFDGTARRLSEYFPKAGLDAILTAHRLALFGDTPVRRWGTSVYPQRDYVAFETIDLPLENDAGERAHILSMSRYRTINR